MRIFGGKVFGADHKMHEGDLCFENGVITTSSPGGEFDASGCLVLPGLIDSHIHGAFGVEFRMSDADMTSALDGLSKSGVTSIVPALTCEHPEEYKKDCKKIAKLDDKRIIGIHSEGPFINPAKKGGMHENRIQKPDASIPELINEASGGMLKIMTMAPELEGIDNVIDKCLELGVKVSLGHSDASYDEAKRAVDLGASRITHTYNAMRPYGHRDPGILGLGLDDERVNCELICDLFHVSEPAIRLVVKSKGYENVTMISDSGMFCGMSDGEYDVAGRTVYVKNGLCQLADGTISSSSKTLFDDAVNMFNLGFNPEEIAVMASVNPAKAADCTDRGELVEGYRADVIVVDDKFNLKAVFVAGERIR